MYTCSLRRKQRQILGMFRCSQLICWRAAADGSGSSESCLHKQSENLNSTARTFTSERSAVPYLTDIIRLDEQSPRAKQPHPPSARSMELLDKQHREARRLGAAKLRLLFVLLGEAAAAPGTVLGNNRRTINSWDDVHWILRSSSCSKFRLHDFQSCQVTSAGHTT